MSGQVPHIVRPQNRRDFLEMTGMGFGALALQALLGQSAQGAEDRDLWRPHTGPHHKPRAKSVIFLFMEGGPSHLDLTDPKPLLNELAGKPLPESFGKVITAMGEKGSPLLASKRKWTQHGESGLTFSDWLPHTAKCADDISVIRSCWTNGINHAGGICQMNTGTPLAGRPSLGAWVSYGLGSENDNLPAFVVMQDNPKQIVNGPRNWGPGFLPAGFQGTRLEAGNEPIRYLNTPSSVGDTRQRTKLDLLGELNRDHQQYRSYQSELDARIESYELAFRMQAEAPEAVDLAQESEETKRLYGLDDKETESYGRLCLLSRRLVERGVRFVQLYHGAGNAWDAHSNIEGNHSKLCRQMDKPVAGLLKDLKRRGLLDETLVVWGGEFGRTPMSEKGAGRDHNPTGFSMWMAGGGVKGGQVIGSTDELGLHAVEHRMHVHDLHATILYMLGLDHMKVIYGHKGRPERPTLNEGEPCVELLG